MGLHTVISQSPGTFGAGAGAGGRRSGGAVRLTPTGHLQSNRLPNTPDAAEVITKSGDHSSRTLQPKDLCSPMLTLEPSTLQEDLFFWFSKAIIALQYFNNKLN